MERFFSETHLPLAERLPGLVKSEVGRVTAKPGGESRFHLMYELYFENELTFQLALSSQVGRKFMQALTPWAEARLITWFYADSYEEDARRASGAEAAGSEGRLPGAPAAAADE